jgi:rRNA maturation protein Nop10
MEQEKCPKCGKMSLTVTAGRYSIGAACSECDYYTIQGVL